MKNYIENFRKKTVFGHFLSQPFYSLSRTFIKTLPDKTFAKIKFKWHMGYLPDLDNPKTLNEKINWLKLNERKELLTICADKYKVREYVSNKIGNQYLVTLYFHTENPAEITAENLPDTPCIIKANHDSSGGIFVYEKNKIDWQVVQKKLAKRLTHNYYWESREWQYKNIKPKIIVEQLLQDSKGVVPMDYKIHCFNAKVVMIQVDKGRGTKNHFRFWYDKNWEPQPFRWSPPIVNDEDNDPKINGLQRPDTLDKMVELSEILAEPFDYVRVDWYDVDGKLYFGELTFHHDGGFMPILPKIWDTKLGELLHLHKN